LIPRESPDALGGLSDAPNPTKVLGEIIERELDGLRCGVEVLVWEAVRSLAGSRADLRGIPTAQSGYD
jgi:hypothetical protein